MPRPADEASTIGPSYNEPMRTPLLQQPESEGFGPPTFEFGADEFWDLEDYAAIFRNVVLDDGLASGFVSGAEDGFGNSVRSHQDEQLMAVGLVVREKGARGETSAHVLSFGAVLSGTWNSGFLLRSLDEVEGLDFAVTSGGTGGGRVSMTFSFLGLPVGQALVLARFAKLLHRTEGTLSLRDAADGDELLLGELPLDVPPSVAEENDDRLAVLEALMELEGHVGERLTIPASPDADALRAIAGLAAAVRSGSVVLPVASFDVPVPASTVREWLQLFDAQGHLELAWGADGQAGPIDVLGPEIHLGPCRYYVQGARLVNDRSELETWLSGSPKPGATISLSWKPLEGTLVVMQYLDWPKPSPRWVEANLRAFEDANDAESAVFEQAYRNGEAWAREVDRADIWMTLIDSRRALLDSSRPESRA